MTKTLVKIVAALVGIPVLVAAATPLFPLIAGFILMRSIVKVNYGDDKLYGASLFVLALSVTVASSVATAYWIDYLLTNYPGGM